MASTLILIVILVIAALLLMVAEIITPSFGVLGTCAAGCLIWAGYSCFMISTAVGVVFIILCVIGVPWYLSYMMKVVPDSRIGQLIFLKRAPEADDDALPGLKESNTLIGKTGKCVTDLRPIGSVKIDGKKVDAIAESGFLQSGQTVKAVGSSGANIIVRPIDNTETENEGDE